MSKPLNRRRHPVATASPGAEPSRTPSSRGMDDRIRWERAAEATIAELVAGGRPFTSTDLVKIIGPPPVHSLLPSVVRAAQRRGLIAKSLSAPMGTVWVGKSATPPRRKGPGRREGDRFAEDLWQKARARAAKDKVPTAEVLVRALQAYLKKD